MYISSVSVVISVFSVKRAGDVLQCIDKLKQQTVQPAEILLILDPDPALVSYYKKIVPENVKVIMSEKFGLSHARNTGVENANGDIVAFIDDDAFPKSDWLEKLMENYDDPSVMSVGGLIEPSWLGKGFRPAWFPEELDWVIGCSYKGIPEVKSKVRNAIGCNMSFRKYVFEKVGGFSDELGRFGDTLLSGEEAQFSLKVQATIENSLIIYDPEAVVYHKVSPDRLTMQYVIRRSFKEGSSKGVIAKMDFKGANPLTSEGSYLQFILRKSIPSKIYPPKSIFNVSQVFALMASVFSVITGYVLVIGTKPEKQWLANLRGSVGGSRPLTVKLDSLDNQLKKL